MCNFRIQTSTINIISCTKEKHLFKNQRCINIIIDKTSVNLADGYFKLKVNFLIALLPLVQP